MGTVVGLWRYPLKSARGERLPHADVTAGGVIGDRVWAAVDQDGQVVSAKHPARGARLLQVRSHYRNGSGDTVVRLPGGPPVIAGTAEADDVLSAWLGRPVCLTNEASADATLRRWWPAQADLVPEWEAGAVPGTDATTAMAGPALRGSLVDYGAIHVIFTTDLRQLAAAVGHDVDPARFRPNLVVAGGPEFPDADHLRIGELTVQVELPTPRCALPGLSPQDGSLDPALLLALARHDRRPVGRLGSAACFGVYVTAEAGGVLKVGDSVSIG
jgi:uncharacterized protein YcbX